MSSFIGVPRGFGGGVRSALLEGVHVVRGVVFVVRRGRGREVDVRLDLVAGVVDVGEERRAQGQAAQREVA
ncbi:hypothetical protein [Streptomyces subrutilus]|uniref:hypothetical protein n=1 Tax=Streptomyces subrutilus TaxID=36818 RepID=UPI0033E46100